MVAIIDYGVGNLYSLTSSFKKAGYEAVVTSNPETIRAADRILLPGVGAFEDAIAKLRQSGLDKLIYEQARSGKKIMGICLGMQLLFEASHEYGRHEGLGILRGEVVPMQGRIPSELMVPHIGWNRLIKKQEHPLFKYLKDGDCVYFVHSYYAEGCEDSLIATTEYGCELTAAVAKDNIAGMQYHPEKSGDVGISMLKAFCEW